MGRLKALLTGFALLAAASLALSACGSDEAADLLPGGTANEINSNLDLVRRLANEGECAGAESAAAVVGEQVEGLGSVDSELKAALRQGSERLDTVVARCSEEEAAAAEEQEEAEEPSEEELLEAEREEEAAQKAAEKEERELEKEEQAEEKEPPAEEKTPPGQEKTPPGQEKKEEKEEPTEEVTPPSGGVSPGESLEGEG